MIHDDFTTTGLCKECPRCGRLGDVYYDSMNRHGEAESQAFAVIWRPREAGAYSARGPDRDLSIWASDLSSPEYGCGYDG